MKLGRKLGHESFVILVDAVALEVDVDAVELVVAGVLAELADQCRARRVLQHRCVDATVVDHGGTADRHADFDAVGVRGSDERIEPRVQVRDIAGSVDVGKA